MGPTIINKYGKLTGWNNIKATVLGRVLEGFNEIVYDDTIEMEYVNGAGRMPIGLEEKDYKASLSIGLLLEEVLILENSLPKLFRIQDIPAFDISVEYLLSNGTIRKDIIRGCKFKSNGREFKSGEGKSFRKYEMVCSHIDWNA